VVLDMTTDRTFLCYAEGLGDRWEAVCLDLDIAVQGCSFNDVQTRLTEAVGDYFAYVETLPPTERQTFYCRRVPFLVRCCFIWRFLAGAWNARHDAGSGRGEFTIACPA